MWMKNAGSKWLPARKLHRRKHVPSKAGLAQLRDVSLWNLSDITTEILPVAIAAQRTPWNVRGSGGIAPRILNRGTNWRWVTSFTPRPLYARWKLPHCPLCRRLGGPRAVLDAMGGRKNPTPCRELNPDHPARSLVSIVTEPLRLLKPGMKMYVILTLWG
jgi:hypothetical protein